MTEKNMLCAQYLKKLRFENHFSQKYVASKLNITRQTYSHYETGRIIPPAKSLLILAGLYQIPVENLITLVYKPHTPKMDGQITDSSDTDAGSYEKSEGLSSLSKIYDSQFISRSERELLSYYESLSEHDKQLVFSFLKVIYEKRKE